MAQGEIVGAQMPEHIRTAIIEAVELDVVQYPPTRGLPKLHEAIVENMHGDLGLQYRSEQVLVSNGAKQCLHLAMQTLCEPGDEVILFTPYWVSYPYQIMLAGAQPIAIPPYSDSLRPNVDAAKDAISEHTRAIVVNSPCNPSGVVWTSGELKAVAELALRHDLVVLSDEVYSRLVFNGNRHQSIAALARELQDRTIVINSLSKSYAMPGWRIGYAAGPETLIEAMTRLQGHITSAANHVGQYAAIAALTGPQTWIEALIERVRAHRDRAVARLADCPRLRCPSVEGTIYLFAEFVPDLATGDDSRPHSAAVAEELVREVGIATVPGSAFGFDGYLRFNIAVPGDDLDEALDRLVAWGKQ